MTTHRCDFGADTLEGVWALAGAAEVFSEREGGLEQGSDTSAAGAA